MIISRSPYRISFAGGGSDLPAFLKHHEGAVVSTTIDKYLYITLHKNFEKDKILLKYSRTENVKKIEHIKNTIARSVLSEMKLGGIGIETMGDIPSKTGLGSSSAFAVGLHQILTAFAHRGKILTPLELAQKACDTEINKLCSPIGRQDQYATAHGGLNFYRFHKNGKVSVEPIDMNEDAYRKLQDNLLLFYTGKMRSANSILNKQKENLDNIPAVIANTKDMVNLAFEMKSVLEEGKLRRFGELLHEGWMKKRSLAKSISNGTIDRHYRRALENGAIGGKLLGAGGGGFLLFYCEKKDQAQLRKALNDLRELPFKFTEKGSEIIFNDEA